MSHAVLSVPTLMLVRQVVAQDERSVPDHCSCIVTEAGVLSDEDPAPWKLYFALGHAGARPPANESLLQLL